MFTSARVMRNLELKMTFDFILLVVLLLTLGFLRFKEIRTKKETG